MQVPLTALRGGKGGKNCRASPKTGGKVRDIPTPHPYLASPDCPSAGGESEEFPGRAGRKRRPRCGGYTGSAARLPLLFSVRGSRNKKAAGKSRRLSSTIRLQEGAVSRAFTNVITDGTECACKEMWDCCDLQRKSDYMF